MSPHAVNNFVSDLVLMAQAMEELPKVKAELEQVKADNDRFLQMVQDRELSIIDHKDTIARMQEQINSLEVARDDAELRFLEADDKHTHSLMALRSIQTSLGESLKVLDPQPEPVPEPMVPNDQSHAASLRQSEDVRPSTGWGGPIAGNGNGDPLPVAGDPYEDTSKWGGEKAEPAQIGIHAAPYAHTPPEGQREPDPIAATGSIASDPVASDMPVHSTTDASSGSEPGQSVPLPTAALPIDGSTAETQHASPAVDSLPPLPDQPYAGKRYYDEPVWVSREAWLAGGGSEYNYDWRPYFPPRQVSGDF